MSKSGIVEELLALEQQQLAGELDPVQRQRWIELSASLTGARREVAEKRRAFRVNVVRRAELVTPEVDPEARVLSVSTGGFSLVTSRRLEPGTRLALRVSLPLETEVMTSFDAEVRWVSDQAGAGSCHGVSLVDATPSQVASILPLLRRLLYQKVEATLSRYESYFESLPEAVLCLDGADVVVAANARARELLGLAVVEGLRMIDLVDGESKAAAVEALEAVRRLGCQLRCELSFRPPAESPQPPAPLEAALAPIPAGPGEEPGVIVTCRDQIDAEEDGG